MTVEILSDGGARISATPAELRTLRENAEVALYLGASDAPFLTRCGVSRFIIEIEPETPSEPRSNAAA